MSRTLLMGQPAPGGGVEFHGFYSMVHEAWAGDALWMPPAPGGVVTSWRNGGSSPAGDLTATGAGSAPTFNASTAALGGRPTISMGVGGQVFVVPQHVGTSLTQAKTVVFVMDLQSTATANIVDSRSGSRNVVFTVGGQVNRVHLYAGSSGSYGPIDNSGPILVVALFNGSASSVRSNGVQSTNFNTGTLGMNGLTVGAHYAGTSSQMLADVGYVAVFDGDLAADSDFVDWEASIADHYGITLS